MKAKEETLKTEIEASYSMGTGVKAAGA